MIEEAIVHVGMHKTGSSSIQETLHHLAWEPGDPVGYLKLDSPNHSRFFMTLLSERPEEYHYHRLNARTSAQVQEIKRRYEHDLVSALTAFGARRLVISAEDLSSPDVTEQMLDRLKRMLLRHCRTVRVIGYVRPLVSYMQFAFQEKLKDGTQRDFEIKPPLWPTYRKRFEKLDRVFGREHVDLVPFSRGALYQNDVVLDFAKRIGLDLSEQDVVRANESLSLEACAVLFAWRRLGKAAPYPGYSTDDNRLVREVSRLGKSRLVFAPELVRPVIEANRADIDWINNRLGQSIEDEPHDSKHSIGSEEDLLAVAVKQGRALWQRLDERLPDGQAGFSTAELVDRLALLTARGPIAYQGQVRGYSREIFSEFREGEPAVLLERAARLFAQSDPEIASTFQRMIGLARKVQARRAVAGDAASHRMNTTEAR